MGGIISKGKKYEAKNNEEKPTSTQVNSPTAQSSPHRKSFRTDKDDRQTMVAAQAQEDPYSSKVMAMVKGSSLFTNYTQFEVGRLCIFFENLCDCDDDEQMSKGVFFGLFPEFSSAVSGGHSTKHQELQMKTLDKIFSTFDENKDDKLDLKEFLNGFSYWHNSVSNFQDTLLIYFKLFDTEKKGMMDIDGFRAMIEHMVIAEASKMQRRWAQTNKEVANNAEKMSKDIDTLVQLVFEDVDEDGSGEIDFNEFKSWVDGHTAQAMMLGDDPETLIKSFRLFDIDGSGTISKAEFSEMLQSTHHGDTNLQDMSGILQRIDNFAKSVFKVVDEDNSGEIEFNEFAQWVKENKGRTETISEAGETLAEITGLLKKAANVMQKEKKSKKQTDTYTRMGSLENIKFKPKPKQRPSVSDVVEVDETAEDAHS